MKKIYLTLVLGAAVLGSTAQQTITRSITASNTINIDINNLNINTAKIASTATLTPASILPGGCATTGSLAGLSYYSITQYTATPTYTQDSRGFIFGTDATYYTQGTTTFTVTNDMAAQKYNVTGPGVSVTNLLVLAGKASSSSSVTMINAKIFSENATTKAPNAQIGVTATKSLNSFVASGSTYNTLTFGTPVPVSGNFFAVIQSPRIGGTNKDTLAILSTQFGCSSLDSLSWTHTVYNPAALPASWSSIKSAYGENLDVMIFPVIDITTGLSTVSKGDLTLSAAFPNPANNEISINFALNQSGKVEIDVYDVTGKVVSTVKLDNLEAGKHISKLNVADLNAGVYMYSVKSANAKMFSKFTVVK